MTDFGEGFVFGFLAAVFIFGGIGTIVMLSCSIRDSKFPDL